ncbi:hypothetical protein C8F04DRAFT_1201532 [Mycena alexandri]|uniref:Uncharacterized protein n=1 Tax=Mycena alexandri TaxID=1745969 RepID=A0AAD6RWS8_9AGAR|nr:hypothetical protein C8F04DRAFT_1201532 [Mycena alexandri]
MPASFRVLAHFAAPLMNARTVLRRRPPRVNPASTRVLAKSSRLAPGAPPPPRLPSRAALPGFLAGSASTPASPNARLSETILAIQNEKKPVFGYLLRQDDL